MIEDIRALAARYTAAANRRDFKVAAATYAHDAALIAFGSEINSREAIEKAFGALFPTLDFIHQQCAAENIEIEGDVAHATWSVTEYNRRSGEEKVALFLGRYTDQIRRQADGTWLFSSRKLECVARMKIDGVVRLG